MKVMIYFSIS